MSIHPHWRTRPETAADISDVRRINLAVFETAEEADLVDALRGDPAWIDGLATLGLTGTGDSVAYALLTRCHVGESAALCLGPCAVLPEHQSTGAGSATIRAALATARAHGERLVTVLGHPTYYPRFGFVPASRHGVRMKYDEPGDALMVLTLDGSDIPAGVIRYAAPFGDI